MANPTDPFAQAKFEDELRFLSHDYYIRRAAEQVPPLNVADFHGVFSDRAIALIGLQQITGQRPIGNRDYRMYATAPVAPVVVPERRPSGAAPVSSPAFVDLDLQRIITDGGFGVISGIDYRSQIEAFVATIDNADLLKFPSLPLSPSRYNSLTQSEFDFLLETAVYRELDYRRRVGILGPSNQDIGTGLNLRAGIPGYYGKLVVGGFVFVPFGLAIEDSFGGVANAGVTGLVDVPLPFPGGIPGGAVIGGILFPGGEPGTQFPVPPIRPPINPGTPGAPPGGIPGIPDGLYLANPADP